MLKALVQTSEANQYYEPSEVLLLELQRPRLRGEFAAIWELHPPSRRAEIVNYARQCASNLVGSVPGSMLFHVSATRSAVRLVTFALGLQFEPSGDWIEIRRGSPEINHYVNKVAKHYWRCFNLPIELIQLRLYLDRRRLELGPGR